MADVTKYAGDRWELIRTLVGASHGSVLDVGCRGRELKEHLAAETAYTGLDLYPTADVIASAEEPLPFADGSFDAVVLADVLEHLDDPHAALDEAMRVAREAVVVLLPNLFTLSWRVSFARGRLSSDKYRLDPDPRPDRHRWVIGFDEAAEFTRGRAERAGWRVASEYAYVLPGRRLPGRLAYGLAHLVAGPGLWAWEYAARIESGAA